jgi:hypothetical protein
MSLTRIPGNQVPVLENNGLMSREWYRFFYNLFQLTGGGSSAITPAELQAEVDALDAAVSGLATDVNTLDAQVTSLDGSVTALGNQVAAVEDETNYSYLEPPNDTSEFEKAIQDAKLSQMESAINELATVVQGVGLNPPVFVNSELGIGSFYDTTTFVPAAINTAYAITFDTSVIENSIYRGSTTSRIYVTNAGVYNFQFSAQLDNTSGGDHAIYIWFRVNGTDIPNSASQVRVRGNNGELLAAWNIFLTMAAGDYFELMYSVEDTAVRILAQAAVSPVPAIPSVILTVNQVYSPYGH